MTQPMLKIIKVPAGEAPEWVRQAWVGLVLPCDPFMGFAENPEKGVLSSEQSEHKRYSYAVPQLEALCILEKHSVEAAAWWRAHGFPIADSDENRFSFCSGEAVVEQGTVARQEVIVYDDMETGRWEPMIFPKGFAGAR